MRFSRSTTVALFLAVVPATGFAIETYELSKEEYEHLIDDLIGAIGSGAIGVGGGGSSSGGSHAGSGTAPAPGGGNEDGNSGNDDSGDGAGEAW